MILLRKYYKYNKKYEIYFVLTLNYLKDMIKHFN